MLLQKCKMKKCSTSVKKCSVEGQCIWHRECSTLWVTSEAPRSQEPRGTNAKTDHQNNGTGSCVSPLREAFLKYGLFIFTKAPQRMSLAFYGWELRELKGEIFEAGSQDPQNLHSSTYIRRLEAPSPDEPMVHIQRWCSPQATLILY